MDDWARVKQAVDIAEVVGRYVPMKKKGSRLSGLCPFHAEKTASFGVYPPMQIFKCFGCGKGGDVFVFLQEHLRLEPVESLRMLAEEAGITLTERGPQAKRQRDQKERVMAALDEATRRYRSELDGPRGEQAREFLRRRKIDPKVAKAFGFGFAPKHGLRLSEDMRRAGHRVEDLEAAGLARKRDGRLRDAFWDRILIPIRDERGRTIAFGGRRLVDGPQAPEPKYINSSDGPVFHKGTVLYGLDQARSAILESDRAVLVEGYTDVVLAHQAGLRSAVAALGTAITPDHARKLQRLAPRVVLFLDGDAAGLKAAKRAVPLLLGAGLEVRVLSLEEGADPGDYFSSGHGLEDFDALLVRDGRPALEFLLRVNGAREAVGFEDRLQVAEGCLEGLKEIADPLRRSAAVQQIASELDLPPEELQKKVGQSLAKSRSPSEGVVSLSAKSEPKVPVADAQMKAEFHVLVALYACPEYRDRVKLGELIPDDAIRDPSYRELLELFVAHPDGEPGELLDLLPGNGELQRILIALEHTAEQAEVGKLLDGAIRYFGRAGRERQERELKEGYRDQERRATNDSEATREFLRAYLASIRGRK